MFSVTVLILTEIVIIYSFLELIYADTVISRTSIVVILACFCFKIMLITSDLSCFKFCRSFEDSDSNIGTLAVEFIALYDLSVMREGIG